MLEQLRQNSRSFIIWILFAIIILAFVFTFGSQGGLDMGGGCTAGTQASYVMKVDGAEISIDSYRFGHGTSQGGGSDNERAQMILDRLLAREILASAGRDAGFIVNKDVVIEEYLAKGKFFTLGALNDLLANPDSDNGTGFMKAAYDNSVNPPERVWLIDDKYLEAIVSNWGLSSIDAFIRQQEIEILAEMTRSTLSASAMVSEEEVRAQFDYQNTTAQIDAVVFRPLDYRNSLALTDDDANKFIEENRETVENKYKEDEARYKDRNPQIRIRQIKFNRAPKADGNTPATDEAPASPDKPADKPADTPADKPAAGAPVDASAPPDAGQIAADAAYARLQAGEDFAKVAMEVSQDERTKNKGGDLGWRQLERPALSIPALTEAAKSLEVGAMSSVIETDQGFFILKVEDKREGDLSFDQVKIEIAQATMLDEYAKVLAQEDAQAALDALQSGRKLEDLFQQAPSRSPSGPNQLPADFLKNMSPEQRRLFLQRLQGQGSFMVETDALYAQSGGAPTPAGAPLEVAPATGEPSATPDATPGTPGEPATHAPYTGATSTKLPITRPTDVTQPKVQSIGPFTRAADNDIRGIGKSEELMSMLFGQITDGQIAPKVFEIDNRFVVVRVVKRKNPDPAEFDDKAKARMIVAIANQRGYQYIQHWVLERCLDLANDGDIGVNTAAIEQLMGKSDDDPPFTYRVCSFLN